MNVRLLYISVSGNTRNFVSRLSEYAAEQGEITFSPIEITDASVPASETSPYFVFVPTYLDGGNGIDNGVHEIMTNALQEQIADGDQGQHLQGIIGSGNKNFNAQYILTARRYARAFHAPVIDNFELRGTDRDIQRIYASIMARIEGAASAFQPSSGTRLMVLDDTDNGEGVLIDDSRRLVSQIMVPNRYALPEDVTVTHVKDPNDMYSEQVKLISNEHYWMLPVTSQTLTFPEFISA
jgi:protein involved in ribonucleotide reduction